MATFSAIWQMTCPNHIFIGLYAEDQGWVSERNRSRIAEIVADATNRSCPFLKTAKRFSKNDNSYRSVRYRSQPSYRNQTLHI